MFWCCWVGIWLCDGMGPVKRRAGEMNINIPNAIFIVNMSYRLRNLASPSCHDDQATEKQPQKTGVTPPDNRYWWERKQNYWHAYTGCMVIGEKYISDSSYDRLNPMRRLLQEHWQKASLYEAFWTLSFTGCNWLPNVTITDHLTHCMI